MQDKISINMDNFNKPTHIKGLISCGWKHNMIRRFMITFTQHILMMQL